MACSDEFLRRVVTGERSADRRRRPARFSPLPPPLPIGPFPLGPPSFLPLLPCRYAPVGLICACARCMHVGAYRVWRGKKVTGSRSPRRARDVIRAQTVLCSVICHCHGLYGGNVKCIGIRRGGRRRAGGARRGGGGGAAKRSSHSYRIYNALRAIIIYVTVTDTRHVTRIFSEIGFYKSGSNPFSLALFVDHSIITVQHHGPKRKKDTYFSSRPCPVHAVFKRESSLGDFLRNDVPVTIRSAIFGHPLPECARVHACVRARTADHPSRAQPRARRGLRARCGCHR